MRSRRDALFGSNGLVLKATGSGVKVLGLGLRV